RVDAPAAAVPALRGARDLNEAREYAAAISAAPEPVKTRAPETLERFKELVERANGNVDARALVRELKAVGGDLKSLRLALTGQESPERAKSQLATDRARSSPRARRIGTSRTFATSSSASRTTCRRRPSRSLRLSSSYRS